MTRRQSYRPPPGRDGARIRALSWKIAALERQLAEELERPLPDTLRLTQLKRRKLRLKDEVRAILVATIRKHEPPLRSAKLNNTTERRHA